MPLTDSIREKDGDCFQMQCRHKKMGYVAVAAFAFIFAIVVVLGTAVSVLCLQIQALTTRVSVLELKENGHKQDQVWDDVIENHHELSMNTISRQKRNDVVDGAIKLRQKRNSCKKKCRKVEKSQRKRCRADCAKPPEPQAGKRQNVQEIFGAHYVGKVESILVTREDKAEKNGKLLKSFDGKFPYWQPAEWMDKYEHKDNFQFSQDKTGIKVMTNGLYYIYAQITFRNAAPDNTLMISVNSSSPMKSETIVRCSHTNVLIPKSNRSDNTQIHTCFGAALHPLRKEDVVYVHHYHRSTTLLWTEDRAFIGLIHLADFNF